MAISNQFIWTALPGGGLMTSGLDYARVKAGLKLAGIKVGKRLWQQIRVIEAGAIAALNRRHK